MLKFDDPRIGGKYDTSIRQGEKINAALALLSEHTGTGEGWGLKIEGQIRSDQRIKNPANVPIIGDGAGERWNTSPSAIVVDVDEPGPICEYGEDAGRPIIERGFTWAGPGNDDPTKLAKTQMDGPAYWTEAIVNDVRVHGLASCGLSRNDHQRFKDFRGQGNRDGMHYIPNTGGLGDMTFENCMWSDVMGACHLLSDMATVANGTYGGNGHFGMSAVGVLRYRTPDIPIDPVPKGVTEIFGVAWPPAGMKYPPKLVKGIPVTSATGIRGGTVLDDFSVRADGLVDITLSQATIGLVTELRIGVRRTALVGCTYQRQSWENLYNGVMWDRAGGGQWLDLRFEGGGVASPFSGPRKLADDDPAARAQRAVFELGDVGAWWTSSALHTMRGRPIIRGDQISNCHVGLLNPMIPGWRPYAIRGAGPGFEWKDQLVGCTWGEPHQNNGGRSAVGKLAAEQLYRGEALEQTGYGGAVQPWAKHGDTSGSVLAGWAGDDYAPWETAVALKEFHQADVGVRNYSGATIPQGALIELDPAHPGGVRQAQNRVAKVPTGFDPVTGQVTGWSTTIVSYASENACGKAVEAAIPSGVRDGSMSGWGKAQVSVG